MWTIPTLQTQRFPIVDLWPKIEKNQLECIAYKFSLLTEIAWTADPNRLAISATIISSNHDTECEKIKKTCSCYLIIPSFSHQNGFIYVTIAHPLELLNILKQKELNPDKVSKPKLEKAIKYLQKRTNNRNWELQNGKITLENNVYSKRGNAVNPDLAKEKVAQCFRKIIYLPCADISGVQITLSSVKVTTIIDHPRTICRLAALLQPQVILKVENTQSKSYLCPRSLASISATLCTFNPCGYSKEKLQSYNGIPDFYLPMPWVSLSNQNLVIRVPKKLTKRGFIPHLENLCGYKATDIEIKRFKHTYNNEILIPCAGVEDFLTKTLGFTTVYHPKKGEIPFIEDMESVHESAAKSTPQARKAKWTFATSQKKYLDSFPSFY